MQDGLKIIFIFLDGVGIGSDDPARNPLTGGRFQNLEKMITDATPLDACLGVDGLPQSATGQATLLTGINAAKTMGRHIEGFPPPALKQLIQNENLFAKLTKLERRCTFANCYWNVDPAHIPPRRQSVTSVMTLSALGHVRGDAALLEGKAVTHDITRWTMHQRGYDGVFITPEEAADHLLGIGEQNDFTLFEYFLTDRTGHSGNPKLISQCLETLECFIPKVAAFAERPNHLFLLCSDHGNIEDLSVRTHTRNPVPLVALGTCAERFTPLKSLVDVTPTILDCFAVR